MTTTTHTKIAFWILALFPFSQAAFAASPSLQALAEESLESVQYTFDGTVFLPSGSPAAGAVVVSSAGGQAVADADGEFRLEARVPIEATKIQLTAFGGAGGKLLSSQQVSISAASNNVGAGSFQLAQSGACVPSWLPTFGESPGVDREVRALAVFDDGTGPALYVAGWFGYAGSIAGLNIARWDGSRWSPLAGGLSGAAHALEVFDDGTGPALFVGGGFSTASGVSVGGLAKWDGSTWSALGTGPAIPAGRRVFALKSFNDGTSRALYVGGNFSLAGGLTANAIAKWDGTSWSTLGSGCDDDVFALEVFDDGTGEALYAGGKFKDAGGSPASTIAKWDGLSWSALGTGLIPPFSPTVLAMKAYDDGTGSCLYVGGQFSSMDGVAASSVARWDGSSWSSLGSGVSGNSRMVRAFAAFDDGSGAALYAAGSFNVAGGVTAYGVAKWDGTNWGGLGTNVEVSSLALAVFDNGSGAELIAGGDFALSYEINGPWADLGGLAKWDGTSWTTLGMGLNITVRALASFDDGSGPALYVAGSFTVAGGVPANRIVKWDGSSWVALGNGPGFGPNQSVLALTVFDDGNGDALYAGGLFRDWGGTWSFSGLAKWDGVSWSGVGTGLGPAVGQSAPTVGTLSVYDDGTGAELIVAGNFGSAGGVAVNGIAKWDGTSWTPLGAGIFGSVAAMTVFDDGFGADLIVGGSFATAGGLAAGSIARWNGLGWAALGSGVNAPVSALAVFDDGGGDALYVGGSFTSAGSVPARRIAKWNGSLWDFVGNLSGMNDSVYALTVFDDGTGAELVAAGPFTGASGVAANRIAKWNGANWTPLGSGLIGNGNNGNPYALLAFDDGGGMTLYAGGGFIDAGGTGDSSLGRWRCAAPFSKDLCAGDGGNQAGCTDCPCGNNTLPGSGGGCLNSSGGRTRLSSTGDTSVSLLPGDSTDLRFAVTGAPGNALCLLSSGDAVASQNVSNPCFGQNSGVQSLSFDGLRCAVQNTRRHGIRPADMNGNVGTANNPWGGEGSPPAGIAAAGGGFVAGQTRYFQVIHRDDPLAVCLRGLNTSQAVEIEFTP